MVDAKNEQAGAHPPVVVGEQIALDYENMLIDGWDETHGVPAEVAERVQEQVREALIEHGLELDKVVFSGYPDWSDPEEQKADGDFGNPVADALASARAALPFYPEAQSDEKTALLNRIASLEERAAKPKGEQGHLYFFGDYESLADAQDGPIAFAATGVQPAVGVYDLEALRALGFDVHNTVIATPAELRSTQVLEFRPNYLIEE